MGELRNAPNYARSAFEMTLKVFCESFSIPLRYKLDAKKLTSEEFLGSVEKWLNEKQKPFLDATLERVKMFRSVVLNQGSQAAAPNIAWSEVQGAIEAVESLLKLTESDANTDEVTIAKATQLAASAKQEDWVPSLGYIVEPSR